MFCTLINFMKLAQHRCALKTLTLGAQTLQDCLHRCCKSKGFPDVPSFLTTILSTVQYIHWECDVSWSSRFIVHLLGCHLLHVPVVQPTCPSCIWEYTPITFMQQIGHLELFAQLVHKSQTEIWDPFPTDIPALGPNYAQKK